jgi:hypothetical protein
LFFSSTVSISSAVTTVFNCTTLSCQNGGTAINR